MFKVNDKKPIGQGKGCWSSLPAGKSLDRKQIVVFQYKSDDGGILYRFAVQKCNCGKPMVEYFPEETTVILPGVSPHDTPGEPQKGIGWVIWCDTCDIHAGPYEEREKTISDWNQLVEALRVCDDL